MVSGVRRMAWHSLTSATLYTPVVANGIRLPSQVEFIYSLRCLRALLLYVPFATQK